MTTRIGVVLSAGGEAGLAFHAGVLAGLAEGTGWDPNAADLLMGTSAGSIAAAALRAGLTPHDMAAMVEGSPLSAKGAALIGPVDVEPARRSRPLGRSFSAWGPSAPKVLLAAARRPWQVRPSALMAGLLPSGVVPTTSINEGVSKLLGEIWPSRPLWICAVRLDDAKPVVFGQSGSPPARVGDAVSASCAIPAYFTPVIIDGVRYVDGGAHSLTHLVQLAGQGLDLVLVIAPLSRTGRPRLPGLRTGWSAGNAVIREVSRAQLGVEALAVRRQGTTVVAFQPTADDQLAMGLNFMDPSRRAQIVRQARVSTLRRLEKPDFRRSLAALTGA
ncbi:MAG TPA: patatin-like phospholipase family protein [Acidimicrobiales bacterium]|nr:patatin-like phospholipase family protein [Acidimicrobiales bacterium]